MINLFVPLYQEAASLIRALGLKKENIVHGWDSFTSEDHAVRLTLMGTGKDNAIAAVSSVFALEKVKEQDFAVLFGSAAGVDPDSRSLYQAVKIEDLSTDRVYYPDLIYSTGVQEAVFLTGTKVMKEADRSRYERKDETVLYDMESAGMYFAAMKHMGPHQLLLFRFVSDYGEKIDGRRLTEEASAYTDQMIKIIAMLKEISLEKRDPESDDALLEKISRHIHASVTMQRQLQQLFRYGTSAGLDLMKITAPYLWEECPDREAGKKVLYAIEQDILDA